MGLAAQTTTLGDRRAPATLASAVDLTGALAASTNTLTLRGARRVVLEFVYVCGGAARTLNLVPEVSVGAAWVPAMESAQDVGAAAVNGDGFLALPVSPILLTAASIAATTISNKVVVEIPEGVATFRVRYSETGAAAPASTITVLATPVYPEGA